jgi:hypothetical protein
MLTPKCRPRDFRVSARPNLPKKCLYSLKPNPKGRNLAGIRTEFDGVGKGIKSFYIKDFSLAGSSVLHHRVDGLPITRVAVDVSDDATLKLEEAKRLSH